MTDVPPLTSADPARVGSYELIGRLGEGGQGVVYLAQDPSGNRVAVKLLQAHLDGSAPARRRFLLELDAAKRVARFCTAQVLDADLQGDRPYIVSEFVDGPSLAWVIDGGGPMTGGALDRLAIGTATALTAIHHAGIVHRDLKPHNVLMGPDGPRVIDFGIAKALDGTSTMSSAVLGTPAYMAPEQVRGEMIGPAADVFAWAAIMVFAAGGRPPFGQDSIPAVLHRILNEEPNLNAVPDDLRELVTQCLHKDAAARPRADTVLMRLLGQETPVATGEAPTAILEQGVTMAVPDDPTSVDSFVPSRAPVAAISPTQPGPGPTHQGAGPTQPGPPLGWAPPPSAEPPRRAQRAWTVPVVVAAAVAIVLLGGAGAYAVLTSGSTHRPPASHSSSSPSATLPPISPATTTTGPTSPSTATKSAEPVRVTVPIVAGKTKATAISLLENAGLAYHVTEQTSETVAAGTVISSSPGAAATVAPGTTVTLTVSTGPAHTTCTVPYGLDGTDQAYAQSAIQTAGLHAVFTGGTGAVTTVSPSGGTSVLCGSTVTVTLGTVVDPTPSPSPQPT